MIKKQTKKELITASFLDLLQTKSFESITVQNITDNCELSRRTFYNFYKDKYDIVIQLYLDSLNLQYPASVYDFQDFCIHFCHDKEENKAVWRKILKDTICCQYLETESYHTLYQYFSSITKIDPYFKALLKFYAHGICYTLFDWILSGCKESSEQIATILFHAIPAELKIKTIQPQFLNTVAYAY